MLTADIPFSTHNGQEWVVFLCIQTVVYEPFFSHLCDAVLVISVKTGLNPNNFYKL